MILQLQNLLKTIAAGLALAVLTATGHAQIPPFNLEVVVESQPTGPNQQFTAKLVLREHSTDISGYQLKIGYDNARGQLVAVTDNFNQPGVGPVFTVGPSEINLGAQATPYANVYRILLLDTGNNILPPTDPAADFNLGRLHFQTSATYNVLDGEFGIYLNRDDTGGVWDGMIRPLPMNYHSYVPSSSVTDWAMY